MVPVPFDRKQEIIAQIQELMKLETEKIIDKVDSALCSGAVSEGDDFVFEKGNFAFAKVLITLHFESQPLRPYAQNVKDFYRNLRVFV